MSTTRIFASVCKIMLCGCLAICLSTFAGPEACSGAEPEAKQPESEDWWRAWAVTKGERTRLVVQGIYANGGPGRVVQLKDAEPQGINPKILVLDLKVVTLPGIWTANILPVPVHYTKSPYAAGTYDSIQIRYPDGSEISVETITDAGTGPK